MLTGYSFGDGALYAKHLFRDGRVLRAIMRDVGDLRRDLRDPVRTHAGIRRFYRFRLFHKARGLCAYWRRSGVTRPGPATT